MSPAERTKVEAFHREFFGRNRQLNEDFRQLTDANVWTMFDKLKKIGLM